MAQPYPLRYVCKVCGAHIVTFDDVHTDKPAVLSFCDKPECRAEASAAYRGEHG